MGARGRPDWRAARGDLANGGDARVKQTARVIFIGKSGSGKTTLASHLIEEMAARCKYVVIVNRKSELLEHAHGVTTRIDQATADREHPDLEKFIEHNRRVHFTVTAPRPQGFMQQLGLVCMRLAEADPDAGLLIVCDEAHVFYAKGSSADSMLECLTGGRALGIHAVLITQMLTSSAYGLDLTAIKQASHLVTFRLSERNEVKRLCEMFPELGEGVSTLARPELSTGGVAPPEYAVKDLDRERAGIVRRDGQRRAWEELSA